MAERAERADDGKTTKRRVSVRVAGRTLLVLTDRDPETVKQIETELNDAVDGIAKANPRMATRDGRADALTLCAIDALCRARDAEDAAAQLRKKLLAEEEKYRGMLADYAKLEARLAAGVGAVSHKSAESEPGGAGEPDGSETGGIPVPVMRRLREILSELAGRGAGTAAGTGRESTAEGEE